MPRTKEITISCDEVKITPNGSHVVSVEMEGFSVDDLLDTIDRDDISEYLQDRVSPEDIFSTTQLDKWAESEGYIKGNSGE